LVHEEQTIEICPKSNALDAKNMDSRKGIVQNLRRTTTTKEKTNNMNIQHHIYLADLV